MPKAENKSGSDKARDTLSKILTDWRRLLTKCVDEAEEFTREKPGVGLAAAFFAGLFAGSLFRRR